MSIEKPGRANLEISAEQFGEMLEDLVKRLGKEWIGFRPTDFGGVYPFYVLPENTAEIDGFLATNGFRGDDNESLFPKSNQYRKFLIEGSSSKQDSENVYMYRVGVKKIN